MINFVLFDRVRVVSPEANTLDGVAQYDVGDIGVVTTVSDVGVHVLWEQRRFEDDDLEDQRLTFTWFREIERVQP